jgi:hypothetical protein
MQQKNYTNNALIGLVILIAVEIGVIALLPAVYLQRSDSRLVRSFGSWLPVARVGSHSISYGQFLEARDAIKNYFASDAGKQAGATGGVTADVEKGALDQLVRRDLLDDLAAEKKINLTNDDVVKQFNDIAQQASSTMPDPDKYLKDTFHWTRSQFEANVIRPELLSERLSAVYASDTQAGAAALETDIQTRLTKPDVHIFVQFPGATKK